MLILAVTALHGSVILFMAAQSLVQAMLARAGVSLMGCGWDRAQWTMEVQQQVF